MQQLSFKLIKEDGNIQNKDEFVKNFKEYLPQLKDGTYSVQFKKYYKNRSLNQNSFYHGVIIPKLSAYFGVSTEEMHAELKYKFLRTTFIGTNGQEVSVIGSTSTLNTLAFESFLDRIRKWFLEEYNNVLPLPNETQEE